MINFLLIGYGVIGKGIIQYLPGNIIVLDQRPIVPIPQNKNQKINFIQIEINQHNYQTVLQDNSSEGTIIIETANNINYNAVASWCIEHNRMFINTSCNGWASDIIALTHHFRKFEGLLSKLIDNVIPIIGEKGSSCLLTHGANPGMVNHFFNHCLQKLATSKQITIHEVVSQMTEIYILEKEQLKFKRNFKRDDSIFYNTWNVNDFFTESIAHADYPDHDGIVQFDKPKNKIIKLNNMTINGRIVAHEETFSLNYYLEKFFNKKCKIQFIYQCSPIGEISRLKHKFGGKYQEKCAIDELDPDFGFDFVGILVILRDRSNWLCGYKMLQSHASASTQNTNATAWFVSLAVLAGIKWLQTNPQKGIQFPELLSIAESEEIIQNFLSYGDATHFISKPFAIQVLPEFDTYECINLLNKR